MNVSGTSGRMTLLYRNDQGSAARCAGKSGNEYIFSCLTGSIKNFKARDLL